MALTLTAMACGDPGGGADAAVPPPWRGFESPLRSELGMLPPGEQQEVLRKVEVVRSDAIRDCMRSEGFDMPPYRAAEPTDYEASLASMSEQEFVAAHGFGIAASMLDALDRPADWITAYADGLVAEDQQAFWRALNGDIGGGGPNSGADDGSGVVVAIGGCAGAGERAVMASDLQAQLSLAQEEQALWDEVRAAIEADPRVIEAWEQWSDCLAAAGFGRHQNTRELVFDLDRRLAELPVSDPDDEGLRAFRAEELRIAQASLTCEAETRPVIQAVTLEYERSAVGRLDG